MTVVRMLVAALALVVLAACGGGGGLGDLLDDEESFQGTVTVNGTMHACTARAPWEQCRAGNCAQCQCVTGCSFDAGEPITQACAVTAAATDQEWAFEVTVPFEGCTWSGTGGTDTLVCDGTRLRLLDGEGHSRTQVMSKGASFQVGGPMVMNDHKLGCEPLESAGTAPG